MKIFKFIFWYLFLTLLRIFVKLEHEEVIQASKEFSLMTFKEAIRVWEDN